VWRGFRF